MTVTDDERRALIEAYGAGLAEGLFRALERERGFSKNKRRELAMACIERGGTVQDLLDLAARFTAAEATPPFAHESLVISGSSR